METKFKSSNSSKFPSEMVNEKMHSTTKIKTDISKNVSKSMLQVAEAMLRLLDDFKIGQISMAMIAERANVSRTALYKNFKGIDDILRLLANIYLSEIDKFIKYYVNKSNPVSLNNTIELVIDAATEFLNSESLFDRGTMLLLQVSAPELLSDYEDISARNFISMWDPKWPVAVDSDEHPFRILTILQTAAFASSLRKYGHVTEACTQETKNFALDYIKGAEARFRPVRQDRNGTPVTERIDAALSIIGSSRQANLLNTCADLLEVMARSAESYSG